MTLYELDLLATRHRRGQAIEDRRAAMAAWILVNVNRDSEKQREPYRFEDVVAWLGTGYSRPADVSQPARPPTTEDLKRNIDAVHLLHKGLYGENGSGLEGEG